MTFKRPESVLVVVRSDDGRYLLLRRVGPPVFWQSVTGSMAWDEDDPAVTARRELAEETGFTHGDLVATGVCNRYPILAQWLHRYPPGVTENTEHVFVLRVPAPRVPHLQLREHDAWVWLPRAAAAARVWSWSNRAAIEAAR